MLNIVTQLDKASTGQLQGSFRYLVDWLSLVGSLVSFFFFRLSKLKPRVNKVVNNEKFTFLEANKYLLETHQNYSTNPNELNTAVEIYHSVFASRLIYLKLLKILTFINPQSEGPMKYHPSVCPFICLSSCV